MILSSAFPALNGGLIEGVADFGRRDGDSDLDLSVTLPEFSGRRGHSHTQWYSLVCRLWLWCLGAGVNTSSSSVSELLSVCRERMVAIRADDSLQPEFFLLRQFLVGYWYYRIINL